MEISWMYTEISQKYKGVHVRRFNPLQQRNGMDESMLSLPSWFFRVLGKNETLVRPVWFNG